MNEREFGAMAYELYQGGTPTMDIAKKLNAAGYRNHFNRPMGEKSATALIKRFYPNYERRFNRNRNGEMPARLMPRAPKTYWDDSKALVQIILESGSSESRSKLRMVLEYLKSLPL